MRKVQPLFLLITLAMAYPAALLTVSLSGCQSGTTGLLRPMSATTEHTVTNTLYLATTAGAAIAPAPLNTVIEAGGGALLALLAAWQAYTHGKVQTLAINNPGTNNKATP